MQYASISFWTYCSLGLRSKPLSLGGCVVVKGLGVKPQKEQFMKWWVADLPLMYPCARNLTTVNLRLNVNFVVKRTVGKWHLQHATLKRNIADTYELYTGSHREAFSTLDNNRSGSGNHIRWAWNNGNQSIKLQKPNIIPEHFSETYNRVKYLQSQRPPDPSQ